jgi:adenosylhomocysteine nucleosidase
MKTLVLIALQDEAPSLRHMMNVFYTGVGKVNAAMTAAQVIERYQPDRVINLGTAGGIAVTAGLHECTRFVQRDIRCQGLGCSNGQTPFEDDIILTTGTTGLTCSTGDDFVMNPELDIPADLVDMEAYAIAKVCLRNRVEFRCFKYITDQADHSAHTTWQDAVAQGEKFFISKLQELGVTI